MTTVVVIGAGPAGVMAAITAAQNGSKVVLLDKNEKIGRKLYISGKGRCNLTNVAEFNDFVANIVSNPKFAFGALKAFSNADATDFFVKRGVPLKTERGGRVFPTSDKASDVVDALYKELGALGVKFMPKTTVESFIADDNRITAVNTSKGIFGGDSFVLATGGKSYPLTGSDGSGYALASSLGHTVIEPVAALSALELGSVTVGNRTFSVSETGLPEGVSLKNVEITAFFGNKKRSKFGEALFTSTGLSGPVVLTLSSFVNRFSDIKLTVDFKPALDDKKLDLRLLREFENAKNRQLKNVLPNLLPDSLAKWLAALLSFSDKQVNSVTKDERKTLIEALKTLEFSVSSFAPIENAIVTAGGIKTSEIDPKTMKSRLIENLSFAGEIIDIDALTGGYNIQLALSTGYVAGKNA